VVREFLPFGHQRTRAHQAALADFRAVQDHGLNADQRPVAYRAAMQHGLVADRHVLADGERVAHVGVHHRAFLHITVFADCDALVIAAYRGAEPHRTVRLQRDLANQRGRIGHECGCVDLGRMFAQLIDGHGGLVVEGKMAVFYALGDAIQKLERSC
jgi:hypothetical protein